MHPGVEYDIRDYPYSRPGPQVSGVAYIKGETSIQVAVTIRNDYGEPVTGSFTLQSARLKVPAPNQASEDWEYESLSVSPTSAQTINIPNLGNEVTFNYTFEGLPEHVFLGLLEVKYDMPLECDLMMYNNGTNGYWHAWEWQYIVAGSPTGLQEVPWTDFLNYTCRWAFGAEDAADLRVKMTRGFHYSNRSKYHRVNYVPTQPASYYYFTGEVYAVKLTDFTINMDSNLWTPLDCRDFAAFLYLAFEANGVAPRFDVLKRWEDDSYPGSFYYWPLCKAGDDSTDSGNNTTDLGNYATGAFGFHCVIAANSLRYDSAASYLYDPSGSAYKNPPADWDINEHWQNYSGGKWRGLAYSSSVGAAYPYSYSEELPFIIITTLGPEEVE